MSRRKDITIIEHKTGVLVVPESRTENSRFFKEDLRSVLHAIGDANRYVSESISDPNATPLHTIPELDIRHSRTLEKRGHLVYGVSGSIQAIWTADMVIQLKALFGIIDVVFTAASRRFVVPETCEYLGVRVWCNPYKPQLDRAIPHVSLGRAADVTLIAPASANTIHRLAVGACSDLLSLVVASTMSPVVIAPSMNELMYNYPPIQRNLELLKECGFFIVRPSTGISVSSGETTTSAMGVAPTSVGRVILAILAVARLQAATEACRAKENTSPSTPEQSKTR